MILKNEASRKTALQVAKYIGTFVLIYVCVLFGGLCYAGGFATDILIVVFAGCSVYVAYVATRGIWELLFLYANLLFSVYLGSSLVTRLYYERISSDDMSLIIGNALVQISLVVTAILICIGVLIRVVCMHKAKKACASAEAEG